jgi:hypothetical protein
MPSAQSAAPLKRRTSTSAGHRSPNPIFGEHGLQCGSVALVDGVGIAIEQILIARCSQILGDVACSFAQTARVVPLSIRNEAPV